MEHSNMEFTPIESENFDKKCRLCLGEESLETVVRGGLFYNWIYELLAIRVSGKDGFSRLICAPCKTRVHEFQTFRKRCREVQSKMMNVKQYLASPEVWPCPQCDKVFPAKRKMTDHLRCHGPRCFKCTICGRGFRKTSILTAHVKTHAKDYPRSKVEVEPHGENDKTQAQIVENEEGTRLDGSSDLQLKENSIKQKSVDDPQIWPCDQCYKVFPSKKQLRNHVRYHGPKCFECPICGKGFTTKSLVASHIKTHDKDHLKRRGKTKKVKIEPRDKNDTSTGQHVTEKEEKTHLDDSDDLPIKQMSVWPCQSCHKVFHAKRLLQSHARYHEPKRFECTVCGKGFARRSFLASHSRYHGPKCFKCTVCGKGFARQSLLAAHLKTHENRKRKRRVFTQSNAEPKVKFEPHDENDFSNEAPTQVGLYDGEHGESVHLDASGDSSVKQISVKREPVDDQTCDVDLKNESFVIEDMLDIGDVKFEVGSNNEEEMSITETSAKLSEASRKMPTEADPLECNLCQKKFRLRVGLDNHKKRMHGHKTLGTDGIDVKISH